MVNADRLYEQGFFVPRVGFHDDFLLGGHVNVARQFTDDPKFREEYGTLSAMLQEAVSREAPFVLLSSELFCNLYDSPDALGEIRDTIQSFGYDPRVLIFLRPRLEYAQSLYVQLVRHGLDCPFDEYLDTIAAEGKFSAPLPFEFRYARIVSGFVDAFGNSNVRVFPYEPGSAVRTFLHELEASAHRTIDIGAASYAERVNESGTFLSLAGLLFRTAIDLLGVTEPSPHGLATQLFGPEDHSFMDGPFHVINARDNHRFVSAFGEDAIELSQSYGVFIPAASPSSINRVAGDAYRRRRFLDEAAKAWGNTNFWQRARARNISLVPRSMHVEVRNAVHA